MILGLLMVLGFVVGIVWMIVEVERCHDKGGMIVMPLSQHRLCVHD